MRAFWACLDKMPAGLWYHSAMQILLTERPINASIPAVVPATIPLSFEFIMCLPDRYTYNHLVIEFKPDGASNWTAVVDYRPSEPIALGSNFRIAGESPQALKFPVGRFDWRIRVEGQSDDEPPVAKTFITGSGTSEITARTGSRREHVDKMINLLENTIEDRLIGRGDIETYTIAGRRVKTVPLSELQQVLSNYRDERSRLRRPRQIWSRR